MISSVLEAVRREVSGARALEDVRAIARFHRVQASPGLDEAAEWVAGALAQAGLAVEHERAPADGRTRFLGQVMPQGWACDRAWADLVDGSRRERLCDGIAEPLSLVLRSAPARGRFPLVAVGEGTEAAHYEGARVHGAVVLASGDVHRVHELAVLQRGAAGLLTDTRRLVPPVRGADDETSALNYTSFWWAGDEPRGWGFVVAPRIAAGLRERLAAGAALELEVEIDSRAYDTMVPLLAGRIPGASPSEILIVSHLCHPRPSANDNASGAAANLEAARVLATLARRGDLRLRRSLRFLWVPELTGTYAFFARDPARAETILAALNLDMVGESQERCGSTFLLEHPPAWSASFAEALVAEIRRAAVDWVTSYSGPGHYSMTRMAEVPYSGGSDHAVFVDPAIGVPCPMLIQWPDRFYHSNHDTPEQCDPQSLALAARCAATYAGVLATLDEAELARLTGIVGHHARRRVLEAVDRSERERLTALEALRGGRALASLQRLGAASMRVAAAQAELAAFVAREGATLDPAAETNPSPARARRPRRALGAPLPYPRRLLPGYGALSSLEREAWRERERATPDAALLADLAWMACDGRRSLADIEHLVWLETGRRAGEFVAALFEFTERLGISEWATKEEDAACNPSAPDTAGR